MSLLASFVGRRTTRTAVVLAAALHGLVLFGLVQYNSRTGHILPTDLTSADAYQPIAVLFVAPAAAPVLPETDPTPPRSRTAPQRQQTRMAAPAPVPLATAAQAPRDAPADAAPAAFATPATTSLHTSQPQSASPRADAPTQVPPTQAAKPDYAYSPQPDYPMLLREQGVGGVVWLRVWVDSEGHPGEIKLAKGSGFRLLDDAALRAVRQWRFVPAKQGAQSLASWVEFPIRFPLNG